MQDGREAEGNLRVPRTVKEMNSEQNKQQREQAGQKRRELRRLSRRAAEPEGAEQHRDYRNAPAARDTDRGGRKTLGLLVQPQLSVRDQRQHAHEPGKAEDQHRAGNGVVFTIYCGQTGLNDFRDLLPQVQSQQHGGRRSQQGKAQRHRGFGRRDMFTEIPAGLPLLLTGEPV